MLGFVLRHASLSFGDLVKVLQDANLICEREAWSLTASPVRIPKFAVFDKANCAGIVKDWPQGHVFCASCEVRWQYSPASESADVLVLTENKGVASSLKGEGFKPIGREWEAVQPGKAGLVPWGSAVPSEGANIRAETRIPHPLEYPERCGDAKTRFYYYRDLSSGAIRFLRLCGVT